MLNEWDIYVSISTYMSTTCRKLNSVHELIQKKRDSEICKNASEKIDQAGDHSRNYSWNKVSE